MFGISVNFSDQENKQTVDNTQISMQDVENTNEINNLQDYVTFVRMSQRNEKNLVSNAAINLKAVATVSASNTLKLKACKTGDQLIKITQSNDVVQTFTKRFDGFISDIQKIKSDAESIEKGDIAVDQGAKVDLSGDASDDQSDDNSEGNSQETDQKQSFTLMSKQISPIKMAKNLTTTINDRKYKPQKPKKPTPFDFAFKNMMRERFQKECPEAFCLYMCAGANVAIQKNEQSITNRQISNQILYNNSKITQGIHSAYTKLSEIYNSINKVSNTSIDEDAEASTSASNYADIDLSTGCNNAFNASLDIEQKNNTTQEMALDSVIKCITDADIEDKSIAYMMDMMNLTQDATAAMKAAAENTMKTTNALTSSQVAEQTISTSLMGIIMIVLLLILAFKLLPSIFDSVTTSDSKEGDRMSYALANLYAYAD